MFNHPIYQKQFVTMYGQAADQAPARYAAIYQQFVSCYGPGDYQIFSAPGRTEIGGNHTDHNAGRVLAASVSVDSVAFVRANGTNTVHLRSEGYDRSFTIDLDDLSVHKNETGTSNALIRGVAAGMQQHGYKIGGFDAYVSSNVLRGSGLSSSAAFEVLIGAIFDGLFNAGDMDPVLRAMIAQYSENEYFGKPCGLMDQSASSVGGLITIDFADAAAPAVEQVAFDFAQTGYSLVIVDTKGDHANLTGEYASIRTEMEETAAFFGKEKLRQVDEAEFYSKMGAVAEQLSARHVLRSMHFFGDNQRVAEQVAALREGKWQDFLNMIIDSGNSSWELLQNCYVPGHNQTLTLALAVSAHLLKGKGAWRVHGGGFAGTMQAFVPNDCLDAYVAAMESIYGQGAAAVMSIRSIGACQVQMP